MAPTLHIAMYHYVLDPSRALFPRLKGMAFDDFRAQIAGLGSVFEMATLESALAFLNGAYEPKRNLCLLTFDDGLTDHFENVLPVLAERRLEGVFSVITGCLEERRVADVHMNHLLMASVDFSEYRSAFLSELQQYDGKVPSPTAVDPAVARRTYIWDTQDVADFKYFYNFMLPADVREPVIRRLFERFIGPEAQIAPKLYLSWEQARAMQSAGMVIGGHSHRHLPLSAQGNDELEAELPLCRSLLESRLLPQNLWPFCYPYGKRASFNDFAVATLGRLGFCCGLSTEPGPVRPGTDLFNIGRLDCKVVMPQPLANASI